MPFNLVNVLGEMAMNNTELIERIKIDLDSWEFLPAHVVENMRQALAALQEQQVLPGEELMEEFSLEMNNTELIERVKEAAVICKRDGRFNPDWLAAGELFEEAITALQEQQVLPESDVGKQIELLRKQCIWQRAKGTDRDNGYPYHKHLPDCDICRSADMLEGSRNLQERQQARIDARDVEIKLLRKLSRKHEGSMLTLQARIDELKAKLDITDKALTEICDWVGRTLSDLNADRQLAVEFDELIETKREEIK